MAPSPTEPESERDYWAMLTPEEQSTLRARASTMIYRDGTVIVNEEDHVDRVTIIRSGWATAAVSRGGRLVPLRMHGPGDLIGLGSAITETASTETVIATSQVHAMSVPAAGFNSFLRQACNASHALRLLQQRRLDEADRLRTIRNLPTATQRLAGLLAELSRPENKPLRCLDGRTLRVPEGGLTQADLGSWIGDSRATVVRSLRRLRTMGLIETQLPLHITIPDPDLLHRFVADINAGTGTSCAGSLNAG